MRENDTRRGGGRQQGSRKEEHTMVCPSPHVLVYGVFLTPCTGQWCVPHPMYWSMVCSSPHVLVYGAFLTPCTGQWCVPHPMYWSMVFLTPCTGLWCVPHPMYWSMVCYPLHVMRNVTIFGNVVKCYFYFNSVPSKVDHFATLGYRVITSTITLQVLIWCMVYIPNT